MKTLSKQYIPHDHEERVYATWEKSGAFAPDQKAVASGKKPYVIMLPPPNVTGSLHMGHALQDTIMDVLIRYHRMQGEPTLWQPGTDHAGIATQNVVEKELRTEGKTRHDLGQEKFVHRVWQWKERNGNIIVSQMKRLGASCDWHRLTFTMDSAYVSAVHEAFVRYYDRGYIYRGNRIVSWCPRCASVISDLEIKRELQQAQLYILRYPFVDDSGSIDVATTRPETMLGDTAVAIHPSDSRYQHLVGKKLRLPLTDREIPIIADERIDPKFGTGAVKLTPAHDLLDAALAQIHQLPSINIIGEDGRLTAAAGDFAGKTTHEARQVILAALRAQDRVVREEPFRHEVTVCDRCGTTIEPLMSRQWFVSMSKLKDETSKVVAEELIAFIPPRWQKHVLSWLDEVQDWTISRQLWWGQQIPVWWKLGVRNTEREGEAGSFVVSIEKPAGDWEQDPDVLDTWFSSALWPFVTLGWPDAHQDLATLYPTSVLVTGRDIVYLWVVRMIFSGLEFLKDEKYDKPTVADRIPFHDVFIHPTVLTKTGQRMSKSLGTGVDPLELIDQYGADATRFGLLHQLNYDSQALKFDEKAIEAARNFANKIWNVARLLDSLPERTFASLADEWIALRLAETADSVTRLLGAYKIGEAARTLYDFIWSDFADWYGEILKVEGSVPFARTVFLQALQLLHPFMPHLTEVLWEHFEQSGMIMVSPWPTPTVPSDATRATLDAFKDIVTTVRSARTLLGIPPGNMLQVVVEHPPLPAALAVLARVELVTTPTPDMIVFPLQHGNAIKLGGATITAAAIRSGQQRLRRAIQEQESIIATLERTVQQMQGKAPADRVAAKQDELIRVTQRRDGLEHSLQLLQ